MLPILMKAADIMENIFWQNAYGNKQALMDTVTDPYLKNTWQSITVRGTGSTVIPPL